MCDRFTVPTQTSLIYMLVHCLSYTVKTLSQRSVAPALFLLNFLRSFAYFVREKLLTYRKRLIYRNTFF